MTDKSAWLERVRNELKISELNHFYLPVEPGIDADPFAHADDFPEKPEPISNPVFLKNEWEIGESFAADDVKMANKQALAALAGGAEALEFSFDRADHAPDLKRLLNDIIPEIISLHFAGDIFSKTPTDILVSLKKGAEKGIFQLEDLRGSLGFDLSQHPKNERILTYFLHEVTELACQPVFNFQTLTLKSRPEFDPSDQLADLCRRVNFYFETLAERKISPDDVARQIQFEVQIGTNYLTEIAKLRALKLLWLNQLRAWGAKKLVLPTVHCTFAESAYLPGDANSNFIRASTMAMSATVGGCSRLTVRPAGDDPVFHRRIARNVQHLLKMESGFDRVQDPAAGSYFIEKLTGQLAEAAWEKLKIEP